MSGAYALTSRAHVAQEVANRRLGCRLEAFRVLGPQKDIEDKRTCKCTRERARARASERERFVARTTHGMHEQLFYCSEAWRHNTQMGMVGLGAQLPNYMGPDSLPQNMASSQLQQQHAMQQMGAASMAAKNNSLGRGMVGGGDVDGYGMAGGLRGMGCGGMGSVLGGGGHMMHQGGGGGHEHSFNMPGGGGVGMDGMRGGGGGVGGGARKQTGRVGHTASDGSDLVFGPSGGEGGFKGLGRGGGGGGMQQASAAGGRGGASGRMRKR